MQIFDENAAKHFPPSQPKDHAIRLKPGAPSEINCKVYPLTKQEMIAIREFLEKNLALGYIEECDKCYDRASRTIIFLLYSLSPCLVDCAPPPLSITCFTLASTVPHVQIGRAHV